MTQSRQNGSKRWSTGSWFLMLTGLSGRLSEASPREARLRYSAGLLSLGTHSLSGKEPNG
jgi:hypothetical protein